MSAGDHLNGVQFGDYHIREHVPDPEMFGPQGPPTRRVKATTPDPTWPGHHELVGELEWAHHGPQPVHDLDTGITYVNGEHPYNGRITDVWVDKPHQRKGLATAMLEHARSLDPRVQHHAPEHRSEAGNAWAKARP